MSEINSKIPQGPLAEKWTNYKNHQKLVNPANKRRLDVIVVGTGLAGASAAASLAEMGFNVLNFCIQDSPRRALRTTRMMVTLFTVCSTIRSKVVTTVLVRLTFIVWLRFLTQSSTSAWLKAFLSLANMVVCWITVHLVALRYRVRFTPVARRVSSFC